MKFHVLNRKVHYWAAIIVALPVLVIIVSGVLLHLKKHAVWIQPAERRGVGGTPTITMSQILETCRAVQPAAIASWDDIDRLDVRPAKGMLKVQALNGWEIQLDTRSAAVLQVEYRRSDLIESIHDGSWFHDWAKLGLFLPSGLTLLILWITGLYLFALPYLARRPGKPKRARC